jgi:hypothetical protein
MRLALTERVKESMELMRGLLRLGSRNLSSLGISRPRTAKNKGGIMKKLFVLVALTFCMAAPSFGADVVGHSADLTGHSVKVASKDTYKAAKVSAKETGKAGKAIVKFLF